MQKLETKDIKLKGCIDGDDYIQFTDSALIGDNCINCGKVVGITWINESEKIFCGFKCIIHYYFKELKKEGKL